MSDRVETTKDDESEVRTSLREAHRQVQRAQRFVYEERTGASWPLFKRLALNRAQSILIRLLIWEMKSG